MALQRLQASRADGVLTVCSRCKGRIPHGVRPFLGGIPRTPEASPALEAVLSSFSAAGCCATRIYCLYLSDGNRPEAKKRFSLLAAV